MIGCSDTLNKLDYSKQYYVSTKYDNIFYILLSARTDNKIFAESGNEIKIIERQSIDLYYTLEYMLEKHPEEFL